MRRIVMLVAVAATLAAAAPTDGYPPIVTKKKLYAANDFRGKAAPEFVVEEWLTGKAPDMKGKVVVIDFWATWCGPCKKLIPEMNEWAAKLKDDVVFIGVSNEKPEVVKKFMETTKMAYHVAIDTQNRMGDKVGVQGIPHCLVIGPDGVVRWQGWPQDDADKLTQEVIEQIVAASKS